MLNKIVVMGRLVRDPEERRTANNKPVTNFAIAVDRDRQDETDFIDVVAWNGTAEFVSKFFRKGSMIIVSGRLQMRKWEDRDGNNRTSYEVLADSVYFGERKKDGA